MASNVTLYNFAGRGDIINSTCVPQLLKEKKPDCFIRICCRSRDKCFFETNPFIDDLVCIDDETVIKRVAYKHNTPYYNNLNMWGNEINTWCCASDVKVRNDYCWASSKIVNMFFKEEIIQYNDNLLPNLYYTEDEIKKANEFAEINSPYIVIEVESFSGQYEHSHIFISNIRNDLAGKKINIKIFTSMISPHNYLRYPFYSLNNFNLKEVGLIINNAKCFYGIGSGMTCVSFERSLNQNLKRVVDFTDNLNFYTRHRPYNLEYIPTRHMRNRLVSDILNIRWI